MLRTDSVRSQLLGMIRAAPFHKFVINMEKGDRVLIEHPENIAFDPRTNSRNSYFSVVTGKVQLLSNFNAVTSIVHADRNGAAA